MHYELVTIGREVPLVSTYKYLGEDVLERALEKVFRLGPISNLRENLIMLTYI